MNNQIEYIQKGDFLFPNLTMNVPSGDIGKYGSIRLRFLQNERRRKYNGLLLSGKLRAHLLEINDAAKKQIEQMVKDMISANPASDKEENQIGWVQHINSLAASAKAEEVVMQELIFA